MQPLLWTLNILYFFTPQRPFIVIRLVRNMRFNCVRMTSFCVNFTAWNIYQILYARKNFQLMFLSLKCSNASGDDVGVMSVAKSRELKGNRRGSIVDLWWKARSPGEVRNLASRNSFHFFPFSPFTSKTINFKFAWLLIESRFVYKSLELFIGNRSREASPPHAPPKARRMLHNCAFMSISSRTINNKHEKFVWAAFRDLVCAFFARLISLLVYCYWWVLGEEKTLQFINYKNDINDNLFSTLRLQINIGYNSTLFSPTQHCCRKKSFSISDLIS